MLILTNQQILRQKMSNKGKYSKFISVANFAWLTFLIDNISRHHSTRCLYINIILPRKTKLEAK